MYKNVPLVANPAKMLNNTTDFTKKMPPDLQAFTEQLLRFNTTAGQEREAQEWIRKRLDELGFETFEWTADAEQLAMHPSFPSDPTRISVANRPSVAGVLEFGDPDAGPTLVLNGHVDVVPATEGRWDSDPFTPTWNGDDLIARGAADMKSGLAANIFAAKVAERTTDANGRIVVESVAGEEEGGIGAAAAALANPYPFERDAAIVTEPTDLRLVTAVEGSFMFRIGLEGQSAHAATRWRGESVLPHLETIRKALDNLERQRAEQVKRPLFDRFETPWPISIGCVDAGEWASSVPASLIAECRAGVAPGESVAEVEAAVSEAITTASNNDEWLSKHPPTIERFSVQFEPAQLADDADIAVAIADAMNAHGLGDTSPFGVTYGADSRHYQAVGIPTVLFGPGSIDQAHFPNESISWPDVEQAKDIIASTASNFLHTYE